MNRERAGAARGQNRGQWHGCPVARGADERPCRRAEDELHASEQRRGASGYRPCGAIASAVVFGITNPCVAMKTKSGTRIPGKPPKPE